MTAIATMPSLSSVSGAAPASSRPSVTHEPTISTIVASWPTRVSWSAHASASSGTASGASHQRAPCIAQPSASAQPGGISSSATHVSTSAVCGTRSIATITTTIDSGRTSAHAPPRKRCSARGTPAAGSATQAACAAVRTRLSAPNHTAARTVAPHIVSVRARCPPRPPPRCAPCAPRATSRRCARAARCRASSRPTTTASTSSSSAAPARAPKALVAEVIVGELARALGPARARARARRGRSAARGGRARPRDPGARAGQRRHQRGARLPARRAALLPRRAGRRDPGAGGRGRLARRADRQRRPHAAQPQHVDLARRAVADRPRRRALPPPRPDLARRRRRGRRSR